MTRDRNLGSSPRWGLVQLELGLGLAVVMSVASPVLAAAPPEDEGFSFEDGSDEEAPPEEGEGEGEGDEFVMMPVDAPPDGGGGEGEDGELSEDSDFVFEDISEDEDALAAELESGEVQATGKVGTVSGVIQNAKGEPLGGVYIRAQGTDYVARTGVDGIYELALPPGEHTLTIELDLHKTQTITGVAVTEGGTLTQDIELIPQAGVMDTFEVSDDLNMEAEGALQEERKQKTSVNDGIDATQMGKSGGGKASSVAVRIVGATIVDGRYLFVRGLGHRYGNTLLDGARVPSPEPEIRTVPLDVIPSGALSAINVQKTFTPDVPGDFTGGSTQFVTRDAPDDPMITIGVTLGANTGTSFQPMVTNAGYAGYDFFGLGDIPRARPDSFPADRKVGRGQGFSIEEVEAQGKALDTRTKVIRGKNAPGNLGFKLSGGDSWSFNDIGGKVGILFAGGYKNEHQTNQEIIRLYGGEEGDPSTDTPRVDLESFRTTYTTSYSGLLKLQLHANSNNRWALTGFYSREAEDETRDMYGIARDVANTQLLNYTRLRYIMRSIASAQLTGRHQVPRANNMVIDYFANFSQARRDDPALREMLFLQRDDGGYEIDDSAGSTGNQLFLDLVDNNENAAVNFTVPFRQWKGLDSRVKFGAWIDAKQREFRAPRYDFAFATGVPLPRGRDNPINEDTIGGGLTADNGGDRPFTLFDRTRSTDGYSAWSRNIAGYASLTLPFVRWFKIDGGLRVESNVISVSTVDPFAAPGDEAGEGTRLVDLNLLPAVALIVSPALPEGRGDLNIRLSGTRTVARPEFRELAPFQFRDYVGGFNKFGYPDLTSSKVWNADLRFEWFPRKAEVVAISAFFKQFEDPIEVVIGGSGNFLASWNNVESAVNGGVELEFRKALDFMAPKAKERARDVLRDLFVGANFSYIDSRVSLGPPCYLPGSTPNPDFEDPVEDPDCREEFQVSTSKVRPLQGQSPWVVNAFIDYGNDDSGTNARVMYNAVGPYIAQVGGQGLPDIYQQPMHMIDFTFSQRLLSYLTNDWGDRRNQLLVTFAVENMLNTRKWRTQGDALMYSTRDGVRLTLGLEWKY